MVATTPLDAVAELQAVVAQLAPALRPQVVPKGAQYGLDVLLALCATDAQRSALRTAVAEHAPKELRGEDDDEDDALSGAYAVGAFDVARRVFNVESVAWLSEQEALVHEFPRFVELQLQEPDQAKEITELFLQRNGHAASDVMAAQQCFNAAFALQTLLRAFPRPPIAIHGRAVEIDASTDVRKAIVEPLFAKKKAKAAKPAKSEAAPAKSEKPAKSKKRKAGKQ